ncbi:hypothetical protein [Actinomadura macra]|uniref:hypothetical protein n=1 Tax=Actinomadura macra TaxID=46164 RepID=UPI000A496B0B|nr:hypothetical protein [Actinomadura macra]
MDPFTIAAAIAFFGGLGVVVLAITAERITQWFRARGRIKAESSEVIAFTLAERIANRQYVEVSGIFDQRPEKTRIVQGFYDPEADEIVDARAMASNRKPDRTIVQHHEEGQGLVIYQ